MIYGEHRRAALGSGAPCMGSVPRLPLLWTGGMGAAVNVQCCPYGLAIAGFLHQKFNIFHATKAH